MSSSYSSPASESAQAGYQNGPTISNAHSADDLVYQNSKKWLMSLYLVVPACMLLVLIDVFFLGGELRRSLPSQPAHWAFWAIFFNFPHIVSSFITMADREYLITYKKPLSGSVMAVTLLIGLYLLGMSLFPSDWAYKLETAFLIFLATYTMYHVMSQQYGLALMMMQHPANKLYQMWRWSSVLAATILYMLVFMRGYFYGVDLFGLKLIDFLVYTAGVLVIFSTYFGIKMSNRSNTAQGRYYVYGNIAMVVACFFCLDMEYFAFVIIIPRVIHDITAFMIYTGHDQNRNRHEYKNFLHGFVSFLKIPPLLMNPILAIGIAFAVDYFTSYRVTMLIIIYFGLLHYYMEGIIWKRDSIHRKSLKFG